MKTFISSTYIDLKEHRRAATEALERLGQEVERMEVFGARPYEPTVASLQEVEVCDLFVGIYAHRYGSIPPSSDRSITEQEFAYAKQKHKPIFCFLVKEDHPWNPEMIESEPGHNKLIAFKSKVSNAVTRDFFTTAEDLALRVSSSVGHFLLRNLTARVQQSLQGADLDSQSLAQGRSLSDVSMDTQDEVRTLLSKLTVATNKLTAGTSMRHEEIDPDTTLALAKGLMAERRWLDAGKKFDEYARLRHKDWEASYLRGVAYANTRGGRETNLAALRAYNDAITFAPLDDPNFRARLFVYRGAMLRRLGRLEEAEADLSMAKRYATRRYEVDDINYNLATIYALRGERDKLLNAVQKLEHSEEYLGAIRAHLNDSFQLFRDDQGFLQAIGAD
jgi:Flp pilus assembly protein TadD